MTSFYEATYAPSRVQSACPATVSPPDGPNPVANPIASAARPIRWAVLAVAIGFAITATLTWAAWSQDTQNERHLLRLRVEEAGLVITGVVPGIETPLASASELADSTQGNAVQFQRFMSPYVGTHGPFVSVSLWSLTIPSTHPLVTLGSAPLLEQRPAQELTLMKNAAKAPLLNVAGLLGTRSERLGYAYAAAGTSGRYAVYAESALPQNRHLQVASNSAFSGFNYALYLGRTQRPSALLASTVSRLPFTGMSAATAVPFGTSAFTLVMSSKAPLTGSLAATLPWIIAITGAALSLLAGFLAERLLRQRRDAQYLVARLDRAATENERLYASQRHVAESLQRALLPQVLPLVAGATTAVRYKPGSQDLEIGGDWYDVIPLADQRTLIVVGDVSGRGLQAANVMASLRFAIRAYAAQHDEPADILSKLSTLVDVEETGHFATVLCVRIDPVARQITIANAGHLPPLLLNGKGGEILPTDIGLPVGVANETPYAAVTAPMPDNATIMMFTDGLIERRDESLDVGLERLRVVIGERPDRPLDGLLDFVIEELTADLTDDDAALLAVQWPN
jgi:serine phosphatase RsbU (regulator of sigma subunit)